MKTLFLLSITFFCTVHIYSQCPPGGLTLSSQADVDAFIANYPECEELDGNLYITSTNIQHLDGLINISSVSGDLYINYNNDLQNLDGLSNLITIGLTARIQDNPLIADLDGLSSLTAVRGDFFYIGTNAALSNIQGLSSLDSIYGIFQLWEHPNLTNLSGLNNLTYVGDRFAIFNNTGLQSIDGLENINYIGNDLRLEENLVLNDIDALHHPIDIAGPLVISNNANLDDCAVLAVCNYLSNPASFIVFSGNATGCSSVEEVEAACLVGTTDGDYEKHFQVYPNPAVDHILVLTDGSHADAVQITDALGKVIRLYDRLQPDIDISDLPVGIYNLTFIHKSRSDTVLFIKL